VFWCQNLFFGLKITYVAIFYCMKIVFIIAHKRNNVVVLFGTLKVQSFTLTEVSDCDFLIVVTSSTFLKRKDMLKEKAVSPDHQSPFRLVGWLFVIWCHF